MQNLEDPNLKMYADGDSRVALIGPSVMDEGQNIFPSYFIKSKGKAVDIIMMRVTNLS